MSKQKIEFQPPSYPNAPHPVHHTDDATFGLDVVKTDESIVADELAADYWGMQHDQYSGQLRDKIPANSSAFKRTLGKLAGKQLRTSREEKLLGEYDAASDINQRRGRLYSGNAEVSRTRKTDMLTDVRARLLELDDKQREDFDAYAGSSMPRFLADSYVMRVEELDEQGIKPADTWHEWFSKQASDEQLLNFLQWHVHQIESQQANPEIVEEIETQKAQYKLAVERAVVEGWLHPQSLEAIHDLENVPVYIGDLFDTHMHGVLGYYHYESDKIVIGQGAGREPIAQDSAWLNMHFALKHEFNHARIQMNYSGTRWLQEALTEHIAQVMEGTRKLDHVRPNNPDYEVYGLERELLDVVLNNGQQQVPIELFTQAYSCMIDPNNEATIDTHRALYGAMTKAWGEGGVGLIEIAIQNYEADARERGLKTREAQAEALRKVRSDLLQRPELVFEDANKELADA